MDGMVVDLANAYRRAAPFVTNKGLTIREVARLMNTVYPRLGLDPEHEDPEHFRTLKNRLADTSNPENEHYLSGLIWRPRRGVYAKGVARPPMDLLDSIPMDFSGRMSYSRFEGTRRPPEPRQSRNPAVRASLPVKWDAQGDMCGYCAGPIGGFWHAVLAHLLPVSADKPEEGFSKYDTIENAFAAHAFCNQKADRKTLDEARAELMALDPPAMTQDDAVEADRVLARGLMAGR